MVGEIVVSIYLVRFSGRVGYYYFGFVFLYNFNYKNKERVIINIFYLKKNINLIIDLVIYFNVFNKIVLYL